MRSPQMDPHMQMYSDTVIGAVEGGTGYWAQVARYKWDGEDRVPATAELIDETEQGGKHITLDTVSVANAMYRIAFDTEVSVAERHPAAILLALVAPEQADLDADDCDVIAQVAAFGEIVYG